MKIKELKDRISYCYSDRDGFIHEFPTLSEAVKSAKKCSQDNPEFGVNIFCTTSIYFLNGDLEF